MCVKHGSLELKENPDQKLQHLSFPSSSQSLQTLSDWKPTNFYPFLKTISHFLLVTGCGAEVFWRYCVLKAWDPFVGGGVGRGGVFSGTISTLAPLSTHPGLALKQVWVLTGWCRRHCGCCGNHLPPGL